MPFDGLVINAMTQELCEKIVNSRIDKIHQPEKDEILLKLRGTKNANTKLLLCVNNSHPYITLSDHKKENPLSPPMFCMLLRKHIGGGKIVDIKQLDFERIIIFSIESYDELGNLNIKKLIVEIMGKHSNIVLVDSNDNKIIDSIKRIPLGISRKRQLLPGLTYEYPPSQNKINVYDIGYTEFYNKMMENPKGTKVYKAVYKSFQGISPIFSKNLCFINNIDIDTTISENNESLLEKLWLSIQNYRDNIIKTNNYSPNIVIDGTDDSLVDFSSVNLDIYETPRFIKKNFDSICETIKTYYLEKIKYERIKQKSSNLIKIINTRLDRLYLKIQKQSQELIDAKNADKYKLYGELILSNLHKISKGMSEVTVENYYEEGLPSITIPLDIRLTGPENSQKYYKKYNKLKTAIEKISEQINETKNEVNYLENVLVSLKNTDDITNIDAIKEELIEQKIIKKRPVKKSNTKNNSRPNKYKSSDGFIIYAGKNNKQNDILTLKTASKNDIWLHTKDIPGSHVVINTDGKEVPNDTLIEAAEIAAFNSKAKYSSNVPVDYTTIKNVSKPSGAKPGMVIYTNHKTIYVTPNKSKILKLKAQSE